ncbi:MAG: hypothetical protein ACR2FF_08570, partial [Mycobacteriales bacterium]
AKGRLLGGSWEQLNVTRAWSVVMRAALAAFYSHPWAWNEIGFPGPAYPRGYLNAGLDSREHWEVADHDDEDPIPFADRVETARHEHADVVGEERAQERGL